MSTISPFLNYCRCPISTISPVFHYCSCAISTISPVLHYCHCAISTISPVLHYCLVLLVLCTVSRSHPPPTLLLPMPNGITRGKRLHLVAHPMWTTRLGCFQPQTCQGMAEGWRLLNSHPPPLPPFNKYTSPLSLSQEV